MKEIHFITLYLLNVLQKECLEFQFLNSQHHHRLFRRFPSVSCSAWKRMFLVIYWILHCFVMYYILFERYKATFNDTRRSYGCRRAEIDFSKPLLASLLHVFQRTDTTQYMWKLWNAAISSIYDLKTTSFCIHVCRVHAHRFLKFNLNRFYRDSTNSTEITATLKDFRHVMLNSSSIESFYRRIRDILLLTKSVYFTDKVREVLNNMNTPTRKLDEGMY